MADTNPTIDGVPPEEFTGLKLTPPKTAAAGFTAVVKSMKEVWGKAGILRGTKALTVLNQKGGVDCPSCAWPDPDEHRSFAEFCENGAKAIAWETDSRRITPEFFKQHSIADLAAQSDYWHGQQGRLTEPMVVRVDGTHYEPISWDDAFQLIATELNSLASPSEADFYTSGRASNEAAFLYQLFVRAYGTNNLPDCSNMCHESSGSALSPTVGIGKGTVKLEDFEKSELILILGQNPGTNHPRMLSALQKAKKAGAKIIAVNPLPEAGLLNFRNPQYPGGMLGFGTDLTDLMLPIRINGDSAFLQAVIKILFEKNAIDTAFIEEKTEGIAELRETIAGLSWDVVLEQTGLSREQIEQAADLIAKSERIITCWAMGLTQHKNAVGTIRDVVNIILLRGSIGKPGAGLCPVRGHSNVQGDRTMGIWEKPPAWFLENLKKVFGFDPPTHHGHDTVEAIRAMHSEEVKVFIGLGGNFLSATPDTVYTAAALRKCRLTVQVSIKLNRSHLVHGQTALILPCLGRTEEDLQGGEPQFVTTENSMGVVQMSQGKMRPASPQLLSETAIVARLAKATLGSKFTIDWEGFSQNYDRIRELISRVIPGFDNYNERVRIPGGFYLPNGPRDGNFKTPNGKAKFTVNPLSDIRLEPGQMLMMTIRTHDQFNTTIYGLDDRYRGIKHERRVILMNKADVAERGLKAGEIVDITSHWAGQQRVAHKFIIVEYPIPTKCAATYFPETNVLIPLESVADTSNTPTSKSVVITVSRHSES
ncbi:FdhF/YdeP family oxidoreductase [Zavarzinella formosa]|uniref:FdhF/YdeP family oxidoreductase n=1 Tax=Zavarzinella formosa TaxID=360055 RepID=UPI0002E7B0FC|nr:FdhF/YdeP family oxidoreductase [Zavarzinella formosa]